MEGDAFSRLFVTSQKRTTIRLFNITFISEAGPSLVASVPRCALIILSDLLVYTSAGPVVLYYIGV